MKTHSLRLRPSRSGSLVLAALAALAGSALALTSGCTATIEVLSDDAGTHSSSGASSEPGGSSSGQPSSGGSSSGVSGTHGSGTGAPSGSATSPGGAADAGVDAPPAPSGIQTLVRPAGETEWVGLAGDRVYYGLYLDSIYSVPAAGGEAPTKLGPVSATGGYYVTNGVAFDASYIYWSEGDGGPTPAPSIYRAPLQGGTPEKVASPTGAITGITVDTGRLYWVEQDTGKILSVPSAGGSALTVAENVKQPAGLALHDGTVYFTDVDGDLLTVPAAGGAIETVVTGPGLPPGTGAADYSQKLVLDDANVYFSQGFSTPPTLVKVGLKSGVRTVLAESDGYGLAVDATDVYFLSSGGTTVNKVPIAGGATVVLASGQTSPVGPAVDAHSVYWATSREVGTCGVCPPPSGVNAVLKVAK